MCGSNRCVWGGTIHGMQRIITVVGSELGQIEVVGRLCWSMTLCCVTV